jgi:hypothetical protein
MSFPHSPEFYLLVLAPEIYDDLENGDSEDDRIS